MKGRGHGLASHHPGCHHIICPHTYLVIWGSNTTRRQHPNQDTSHRLTPRPQIIPILYTKEKKSLYDLSSKKRIFFSLVTIDDLTSNMCRTYHITPAPPPSPSVRIVCGSGIKPWLPKGVSDLLPLLMFVIIPISSFRINLDVCKGGM